MKIKSYILMICLIIVGAATSSQAQLKPSSASDNKGPIAISSDRLETDDQNGVVTFIGGVIARQGEMTITCDNMKVFYTQQQVEPAQVAEPEKTDGSQSPFNSTNRQIDRVECQGNVKMVDGDQLAVGKTALYLARSAPRRLILTGDARVWQGRDSLTGHQITYYLDERRSLVESRDRERVQTIFHQEDAK